MKELFLLALFCSMMSLPLVVDALAAPNKLEKAAISRFQRFDKLCKTCPTLIQPRVDTLTEMILGLSEEDRAELMANVEARLQEDNGVNSDTLTVRSAEEVYKFQTGADAMTNGKANGASMHSNGKKQKKVDIVIEEPKPKLKLKMDKLRSKFEKNKYKLRQVQALLDQTNALLKKSNSRHDKDTISAIMDPSVLHATEELQQMSRTELKMQRLKYKAQQIKCEQKMAKTRFKLYGASLKLERI